MSQALTSSQHSSPGNPISDIERRLATVSDAVLDDLALQITRLSERAARSFVVGTGKLISDQLYQGDLSAWRTRGPKDFSLRRLAARPSLGVSPATLYRALAAYELLARAGSLARWPELSVSHFRTVSGIPFGDQSALLDRAEREGWSVARLNREAGQRRRRTLAPVDLGAPSQKPAWWRKVLNLRSLVGSEMKDEPSPTEREKVLAALSEIEALCSSIRTRLNNSDGVSTWKHGNR